MSKYVIISDLHVAGKQSRLVEGKLETIYYPLKNLYLAYEKAKELDAPLIIAGDINDAKRLIPQIVITEVLNALAEIGNEIDVYLILGNHDYELVNGKIYTYLLEARNINIITPGNPLVLNGELGLVAYSYNRDEIINDIINIDPFDDNLKGIVSHFGLQEGKLSGSEYRTGEFSLKQHFQNYDKWLILGHYHKPQQISDKVLYVGSPYPISKAEIFEEKRFIVLDLDKDKVESIPTIYPKWIRHDIGKDDSIDIKSLINKTIDSNYHIRHYIHIHRDNKLLEDIQQEIKKNYVSDYFIIQVYKDEDKKKMKSNIKDIHEFKIEDIFESIISSIDFNEDERKEALQILNAIKNQDEGYKV
jgi:DNA repair exonuclease SbcCD nuclease subunit